MAGKWDGSSASSASNSNKMVLIHDSATKIEAIQLVVASDGDGEKQRDDTTMSDEQVALKSLFSLSRTDLVVCL